MNTARPRWYWLPPVLYLSLIFLVSSLSQPPLPPGISGDWLHFPEYALLGLLLARALDASLAFRRPFLAAVLALGCSTVWGATDEFHQAFVPGRVPDLLDLAHDSAGAAAGAVLWLGWRRWRGTPGDPGAIRP